MLKVFAVVGELTNKIFPKNDSIVLLSAEDLDDVAEIAYTTVAAFQAQHDGVPRKPWVDLLDQEKQIAKNAVKRVVNNPHALPDELHEKWVHLKRDLGWTYGPVKNTFERKHPELLPYKFLPLVKQRADLLFYVTIHTLVSSLRGMDEAKAEVTK